MPIKMALTENEHITRIINGEHELFASIVYKYKDMVFRVCAGFCHNADDAADLSQEVFIKAYENLEYFGQRSRLSTWLYRIAVNTSLNSQRKKKRERVFSSIFGGNGKNEEQSDILNKPSNRNPEKDMIESQERELINNAIDQLPDKQRTAFVLSKYEELSQREVAEIMNTTEGAVEQLLIRAKTNLQKKLTPYYKNQELNHRKNTTDGSNV